MKVLELNENTRIPVRIAWALGGSLGAALIWFTTMYWNINAAQAELSIVQFDLRANTDKDLARDEKFIKLLHRIDTRLARMEVQMGLPPPAEEKE